MKLRPLRSGETIAVVSPSSPIAESKLQAAKSLLTEEGYEVEVMPHALDANHYLAGTDHDRAADLMEAFTSDKYAAVFCARGGYGCARLLPHLDLDAMADSRKMFLGFSDITTLHLALNRRGMPTIHSPMGVSFSSPREPWVLESFKRVLRGDLTIPTEAPRGVTIVGGVAEGSVVGGCLCLLCDSIGTKEQVSPDGAILVIEDIGERPHRVDAMLTHLLNAGIAQRAAGFLVGEMTDTDEKLDSDGITKPWRDIVCERLAPLGKPMIFEFPLGHVRNMLTLPLGVRARLDADAGTLTYLEGLFE